MVRAPKERKDKRPFSVRTDTEPLAIVRDLRNGTDYIKRRNGSLYPKLTTITLNEPVKRMLKRFKEVGGYANYNELILQLLLRHTEAKSIPKLVIEKAKYNIKLQREAREKAMKRRRYKTKKPIKPDEYVW